MTARRGRSLTENSPLVYGLALVVVALTLGPVLYGALGGFRSNEQLARDPAALPHPWVFTNYSNVVTDPDFWRYAVNSTVIAIITTAIAVIAGVMAAKRTAELIPLCHQLPLSAVHVTLEVEGSGVRIAASAETSARTGVEMEALVAASVAAGIGDSEAVGTTVRSTVAPREWPERVAM